MRKCSSLRTCAAIPVILLAALTGARAARASETPLTASSELANANLERARGDVARVQLLVEQGSLPRTSLAEAESRLDDVQDQVILADALYSSTGILEMTTQQTAAMLAAAQRRVDRQDLVVSDRQKLLEMGIISRLEMRSATSELDTRRQVLSLLQDRIRIADEQRQMAAEEQRLARAIESGKTMIRYEGSGQFQRGELDPIANEFEQQFHHPLPITAIGQTPLHQALGLDHHGKIDVGLNPTEPEGLWLRHALETRQIPYIAFRSAVRGSATAPHIHIGTGSTRIGIAQR